MTQGEVREHVELGSAEDLRLERLLEDLHSTVTTLALSLNAVRKKPENVVYRASADQQAQLGRAQIRELLSFAAVLHSDQAAGAAVQGIADFVALDQQLGSTAATEQLRAVFAEVAERLFDPSRPGPQERPCAAICELLSRWVEIPAAPAEDESPAPAPAPAPDAPQVLFEWDFVHDDSGAPKPWLGRLLLAVFEHVRGFDAEKAASKLHVQALIGFDQSIQDALGDYRGMVSFRIVKEGDATPRIELRRRVGPAGA